MEVARSPAVPGEDAGRGGATVSVRWRSCGRRCRGRRRSGFLGAQVDGHRRAQVDAVQLDVLGTQVDGNTTPGDGCSATCQTEYKPNLLLCGNSTRNVAEFIPNGVMINVVSSCTPDVNTQAMLVTRSGNGFNPAALKTWVEGGGIVLTEVFISDEVYNAVFNAGLPQGGGLLGSCTDRLPSVVQFTNNDPFWADNPFTPITLGQAGCGTNVAAFPMLTPLAGWSANQISVGYRNAGAGAGRVWVRTTTPSAWTTTTPSR